MAPQLGLKIPQPPFAGPVESLSWRRRRRRAKLGGLDFNVSQDGCAFEKVRGIPATMVRTNFMGGVTLHNLLVSYSSRLVVPRSNGCPDTPRSGKNGLDAFRGGFHPLFPWCSFSAISLFQVWTHGAPNSYSPRLSSRNQKGHHHCRVQAPLWTHGCGSK